MRRCVGFFLMPRHAGFGRVLIRVGVIFSLRQSADCFLMPLYTVCIESHIFVGIGLSVIE